MIRIAAIATAAMLAGVGLAAAQSTTTTSTPSATMGQTKCWDSATKQVRDMTTQLGSTNRATTPSTNTGSSTGNTSGSASSSAGSSSSGSYARDNRPAEAAGLPDCK
jgi:hypothetical protein